MGAAEFTEAARLGHTRWTRNLAANQIRTHTQRLRPAAWPCQCRGHAPHPDPQPAQQRGPGAWPSAPKRRPGHAYPPETVIPARGLPIPKEDKEPGRNADTHAHTHSDQKPGPASAGDTDRMWIRKLPNTSDQQPGRTSTESRTGNQKRTHTHTHSDLKPGPASTEDTHSHRIYHAHTHTHAWPLMQPLTHKRTHEHTGWTRYATAPATHNTVY